MFVCCDLAQEQHVHVIHGEIITSLFTFMNINQLVFIFHKFDENFYMLQLIFHKLFQKYSSSLLTVQLNVLLTFILSC